jgi:hypothetical protein
MHEYVYKALPGLPANATEAQAKRRAEALTLSKERRQHAFDVFRSASWSSLDLSLNSESDEEETEDATVTNAFGMEVDRPAKPKPASKYANKLTFGELLPLPGLPVDLFQNWIACIVPKGRRCLAITYHTQVKGKKSCNCLLLSRQTGQPVVRLLTAFPPRCALDVIFDGPQNIVWVLDVIEWATNGLSESSTELRFASTFYGSLTLTLQAGHSGRLQRCKRWDLKPFLPYATLPSLGGLSSC